MKTKTKKPTKTGFIKWLRAQPKGREWDYYDNFKCPFACYLKSLRYRDVCVSGDTWTVSFGEELSIPDPIADALGDAVRDKGGLFYRSHISREDILEQLNAR